VTAAIHGCNPTFRKGIFELPCRPPPNASAYLHVYHSVKLRNGEGNPVAFAKYEIIDIRSAVVPS